MFTFERRCTGHCCKAFILPWMDPVEHKNETEKYKKRLEKNPSDSNALDGLKICLMVEYLGDDPRTFDEFNKSVVPLSNIINAAKENKDNPYRKREHYYTCKNYCKITNNCLTYEDRPEMCKKFPENDYVNWNGACSFRGCTKRYPLSKMIVSIYNIIKVYIRSFRFKFTYIYKNKIMNMLNIPNPIRVKTKDDDLLEALCCIKAELNPIEEIIDNGPSTCCSEVESTELS